MSIPENKLKFPVEKPVISQPEDNYFQYIPNEIMVMIGDNLDISSKATFIQTSGRHHSLFAQEVVTARERTAHQLLEFVAQGEQDKAEALIKKCPQLLIVRTSITDWTGRTFKSISAWEYALWALDTRYMCDMMLKSIPNDKRGMFLKDNLLSQYDSLEKNGVTYELESKTITQSHFSFEPLISALEKYVDNYDGWDSGDRRTHWITGVGGEQRHLVVHVRQHYCDTEEGFYPLPSFEVDNFTRNLLFYNWITDSDKLWSPVSDCDNSTLGVDFAISSGGQGWMPDASGHASNGDKGWEALALSTLCKVRIEDFKKLKGKLKNVFQNDMEVVPSASPKF
jgi:hypothetical protein